MMFSFFEMEMLSSADINSIYFLMPADRREKFDSYRFDKDRRLCAVAYILLLYGIYSVCGKLYARVDFEYNIFGKPSLKRYPEIFFNISHCKNGVVCVLSKSEVGVDLQDIVDVDDALVKLTTSQREGEFIWQSEDRALNFTRLWACKESYLKCIGKGLNADLPSLDFAEVDCARFYKYDKYFSLSQQHNCVLCCCTTNQYCQIEQELSVCTIRSFLELYNS